MKNFFVAAIMAVAIFIFANGVASAGANLKFQADKLILNEGQAVLYGHFINSGDQDARITHFLLENIRAVNNNDFWIWSARNVHFYPKELIVPSGQEVHHIFTHKDADCPARGQVKSSMNYRIFWDNLNTPSYDDEENYEDAAI